MRRLSVLPNLFTLGNGICGTIAILYTGHYAVTAAAGPVNGNFHSLAIAAWLIFLGMIFDGIDGKIARMTDSTSEFGAQLDSLCDAVTFGIAPAFLVSVLHTGKGHPFWEKIVWFFAVAYASCALMRLARYNVEQAKPEEEYHLDFRGLPSPGAGGLVASLVVLTAYLNGVGKAAAHDIRYALGADFCMGLADKILAALPFVVAALAYLMISNRIRYPHLMNSMFRKKQSFVNFASLVLIGMLLVVFLREATLAVVFLGYVGLGVMMYFWRVAFGWTPKVFAAFSPPEHSHVVLIGIGSNMGTRRRNIQTAIEDLHSHDDVTVVRRSKFIKTRPVGGPEKQRKYLNGAVLLNTSLKPHDMLALLQEIEEDLGRERDEHWGPRPIDLDILLYDNLVMKDDDLEIPHPRMLERDFVLGPASEIAPELVHPVKKITIEELEQQLTGDKIGRTA